MDDKLFDVFSEETEVPECVRRRVDETVEMIENSAESDKGYRKEEKTGKVINGTDRMGKIGTRKNWKRSLILTFAAVMAFGATVFAAEKYIGISGFFQEVGNKLPEEAKGMIEKDPVQQEDGDSILTYTVKEALCDKNSVQVVMEVTAKERGKYLLAGQDTMNEDPVRNLGIESDKTIGEYAAEKGLIIVKTGVSFDFNSDLGIETAVVDYRNLEDDVVDFYSSAVKTKESKDLTVSCIGTATLPDAKCVDDVMRTNITFQLEDKSQGKSATYVPVDGEGITADGKVKILSADIEETEVGDYATIHCIFLEESDSISLDVTDLDGNLWQISDLGGGSEVAEVGKEATFQMSYQKTDLADEIGIRAYDCETDTAYEPVRMKLKE